MDKPKEMRGLERMDALDLIRTSMVRNREKPEIIQAVTEDYLELREQFGL